MKMNNNPLTRHNKNAFNTGDLVFVACKLGIGEMGTHEWKDCWVEAMNEMHLKTFKVEDIDDEGVYLEQDKDCIRFSFPSACLTLVAGVKFINAQKAKKQVSYAKKAPRSKEETALVCSDLQVLQELLRGYLSALDEAGLEVKDIMGNLWDKCDPDRKHHSDVQYAYNNLNTCKARMQKIKQWKKKLSNIQNKIKHQLGNPK